MLNKEAILIKIKTLNLPITDYWITAGSALVIHGVKESTNDIDLGCTNALFQHYLEKGFKCRSGKNNSRILIIDDDVELIENWLIDEIEFIEGLPVGTLESIKKQKINLGRTKDISDVKLIDEFIKKK